MNIQEYPLVSDWLRLDGDHLVIRSGKVELGQRITTALMRIVAEELTLPLAALRIEPVRTGVTPDEGVTSGSNSVVDSGGALRLAAATLRARAMALAAERLAEGVADNAPDLRIADGRITDPASGRHVDLLEILADCGDALPVDPDAVPLPLADRAPVPSAPPLGLEEIVRGAYAFVQDLERPGMLHARIIRPPRRNGRLEAIDAEARAAMAERGLEIVQDGSFLAVAGPAEWDVIRGATRLARGCSWTPGADLDEGDYQDLLLNNPRTSVPVVDGMPQDAPVPPPFEAPDFEATFTRPYQLHGAMGPSAALAEWGKDGRLDLVTHSQGIYPLRQTIAESLGLEENAITISHAPGPGCYGHNGADDAAFEAVLIARALPGRPVLLKWTREDEHGWEPVAPAMVVRMAARLEGDRIAAYSAEAYSDTHRGRPRPGPDRAGPRRLLANTYRENPEEPFLATPNMTRHAGLHRNLDPIYRVGEKRMVKNLVHDLPLRSSAMRCLGAAVNTFAHEAFLNELAEAAGQDPLEFRRAHLEDPHALAVLDRLAEALADSPPAEGVSRGIAYAQYKNRMTRVAAAVDLRVTEAAEPVLERILLVADAGRIVDPEGLREQLEGGALQGASWALVEELHWDRDGVIDRDWDSYPVLRFPQVPRMETLLIDRPDAPSVGAGEASPGPVIGAIANALYGATGMRMRRMPFTADRLMSMALAE